MARKGENIYKRKDGRWEGRWIESYDNNGKAKYRSVYAKSYAEVRALLAESKNSNKPKQRNDKKYIRDYSEIWLVSVKISRKESTYAKYVSICNKHILPYFGAIKPDRITTEHLERFLDDKIQVGLSSSTVMGIKTVFQLLLTYACPNTLCDFSVVTIKPSYKEMRVFSVEEQRKLCTYLKNNMDYLKLGVYICLFTGLRIGEICALQWKNIDLESKTIIVSSTIQRVRNDVLNEPKTKIIITTPKSKHSLRKIPISTAIANLLSLYQSNDNNYLLTGNDHYIEPRTLQNHFKRYLLETNIADSNFHCTRHTFATRCIEAGMDVKSLSEILGHANINITMSRYVHLSMDWKRENIEKLSNLM